MRPDIDDGDVLLEKQLDVVLSVLLLTVLGLFVALAVRLVPHLLTLLAL